jgi:hypothetical protein
MYEFWNILYGNIFYIFLVFFWPVASHAGSKINATEYCLAVGLPWPSPHTQGPSACKVYKMGYHIYASHVNFVKVIFLLGFSWWLYKLFYYCKCVQILHTYELSEVFCNVIYMSKVCLHKSKINIFNKNYYYFTTLIETCGNK